MAKQKLYKYIVRKCVVAPSATQAIKKAKDAEVMEVSRVGTREEELNTVIGFDAQFADEEFD